MGKIDAANAIDALNALAHEAHDCAVTKGWYVRHREPPELLCLIHSELSECLEAYRRNNPASEKIPPTSQAGEELADAIIRILDMAAHMRIDIGEAVIAKMRYNWTRETRHGGKAY